MTKKAFTRMIKKPVKQVTAAFEEMQTQEVMPYDENLLEHARTQWQFGDWAKLARIERDTLQHHPDRAKLALLAAAGRLQTGDAENARSFVQLARDWGCSKRLISQILISGVHNSLGRALALTTNHGRAIQHYKKAIEIGMPSGDSNLLSQARMFQQVNVNGRYVDVIEYKKTNAKLTELYMNHTGYVSDKWSLYLQVYESILSPFEEKEISLLEIGIQNGGSLEIWDKFFSNAKIIVGCDVDQKCAKLKFASKKIKLAIGDIKSNETEVVIDGYSNQFDIIIDDGSHKSSDVVNAFCLLFPKLSHGGIYVVEDMHCSYWKDWEGGLDEPKSSISFFKSLVDLLNHEHWESELSMYQRLNNQGFLSLDEDLLSEIHSIKFYNSMCVVEKRRNHANVLGIRHVVGFNEKVSEVKKYNGTFSRRFVK